MYSKVSTIKYKRLRHLLAMPFILLGAIPLVFFDFFLEIYHRAAFPLYGIKVVKRRKYIKIDRHKLSYLNAIDKIWCTYCGYANGLLAYAVKIAGDTEKYWCAIKHKPSKDFVSPEHHNEFLEYGDREGYERFIHQSRK
ncbi:hypothetical protein C4544_01100 [candidate division WS5 bacterium]|uniref:Uncharacterized protein n=1 Tax=candidate division WS5 bacterium TaxID=2093353 RepID=A0A419DG16_9BACT|nr:MAG: hypothetical protein C4544_01100 [candidate division WS5 bacterium]